MSLFQLASYLGWAGVYALVLSGVVLLVARSAGRPRGKRSDPGFVQATSYIPAEVHHNVKLALLRERKGREFSELVADLLAEWLATRPTD